MFEEWPKFSKNDVKLICLNKMNYFNMKLEKKMSG